MSDLAEPNPVLPEHEHEDTLFAFAPDAILIVGHDGQIIKGNPQAEQIFGYSAKEFQGLRIEHLIPSRYRHKHVGLREEYTEAPHLRRMGSGLELWALRKNGSEFAVEVALGPQRLPTDTHVLCIVRDVTDQQQARAALQQINDSLEARVEERTAELQAAAQSLAALHQQMIDEHQRLVRLEKLSSIGLLAASIVHEVNNPLSGVRSLVASLTVDELTEDKRTEYLAAIKEGLDRVAETTRGLLDLAREQPVTMTDIYAAEVCAAALRLVGARLRSKGIVVDVKIPLHEVFRGDRSRVVQALLNLLINASDATPSGGSVIMHLRLADAEVGLAVTDTGSGIPKEIADRVAEPFFSTKPTGQGTGLGLAVVNSTMKAHRGRLQIETTSALGTTMTLWFPR